MDPGQFIWEIIRNPLRLVALLKMVHYWANAYFAAQKSHNPDRALIVETPIDHRIAFNGHEVYPYLIGNMYCIFVGWHLLTKVSSSEYEKARQAYFAIIDGSIDIFNQRPTRMESRRNLSNAHPLLRFVQSIDGETNCFPSIHISVSILSYCLLERIPHDSPEDQAKMQAMRKVCLDVCRSTLSTKQHSVACVIGGMVMARRAYAAQFGDVLPLDLLWEFVPEITTDEQKAISSLIEASADMEGLLFSLLSYFKQCAPVTQINERQDEIDSRQNTTNLHRAG